MPLGMVRFIKFIASNIMTNECCCKSDEKFFKSVNASLNSSEYLFIHKKILYIQMSSDIKQWQKHLNSWQFHYSFIHFIFNNICLKIHLNVVGVCASGCLKKFHFPSSLMLTCRLGLITVERFY